MIAITLIYSTRSKSSCEDVRTESICTEKRSINENNKKM